MAHLKQPSGEDTPDALRNTSPATTQAAGTEQSSTKTSPATDLPTLRLQASVLAASLGEFLSVPEARVLVKTIRIPQPDGTTREALQILVALVGHDLGSVTTNDGTTISVDGSIMKEQDEN